MALTDQAITQIKGMIMSGQLKPGDRLPPEKELSEALGLSRSSLREAVKALEMVRVLDVRRGNGTYVTSLTPSLLLDAMSFMVDIHQDVSVLELFEVRRILEPAAAALAAVRITASDVAYLKGLLAEVEGTTPIEDLVSHDVAFHRHIAELSGNAYLARLLENLSGSTLRARIWRGLTQDGATDKTLAEHQAIVDALESGDPGLVSAQVTVHVNGVAQWVRRALA